MMSGANNTQVEGSYKISDMWEIYVSARLDKRRTYSDTSIRLVVGKFEPRILN